MNDQAADSPKKKRRKHTQFFRACRFLWPYRRMVTVSVIAAVFVGLVFSSSIGAMLPILRVLINNDTLASWMDRQVIGHKIDATLDDSDSGLIVRVKSDGRAAHMGVKKGDTVTDLAAAAYAPRVAVQTNVGVTQVPAHEVKWHLALGQRIAHWFPQDREWGAVKTIAIILVFI